MAYKFQLGDARMSGSLTQEEGISSLTVVSASNNLFGRALVVDSTTRIDSAGAATLGVTTVSTLSSSGAAQFQSLGKIGNDATAGKMLLGSGAGFQPQALSGDATITGLGAMTINSAAVTYAKIQNVTGNSLLVRDNAGSGVLSELAVASTQIMIGDGAGFTAAALSGDVTMTNGGAVTIADNAVSLAKMAGLTRGSIIYGDASGDPANLAKGAAATLLQSDGTDVSYVAMSGDATIAAGGALTIAADAVESGMLNDNVISGQAELAQGALVAADEFMISDGGTLKKFGVDSLAKDMLALTTEAAIADGDYLMFLDGGSTGETKKEALADVATLFAGGGLAAASSVIALDLNSLGAAIIDLQNDSVAIIDGDDNSSKKEAWGDVTTAMASHANGGLAVEATTKKLLLDFNDLAAVAVNVANDSIGIYDADGAVTGKESIVDLAAAMAGSGVTATAGVFSVDVAAGDRVTVGLKANGEVLAAGLNHTAAQGSAISLGLPSGSASTTGDIVYVKANSGTTVINTITISSSHASAKIEGVDGTTTGKLVLESPYATVGLIYVDGAGDNNWVIF